MPSKPDYYAILGVFRDASQEDIKRAYFEAAQRLHPDKNEAPGETELFLEVQQAYEVLSNPKRRNLYDATLPPEIKTEAVVDYEVLYSRPSLVRSGEPQLIYALLEVSPREETKKTPAPPLNLCLVLDRSTSMRGEKLDMVKATAIQLLRSLRPEDLLSVVAFSDRANILVPATLQLDLKKQENSIHMLQASGGTELYNGLKMGYDEVRRTFHPSRVNHVILLTDGNTYGDEQKCLKIAEEASTHGIGISGMGIGDEWNDIFLDALAGKTGGSSAYISNPKDIQRLLINKFNALISTYADDVTLELKERKDVKTNYAFRLQPDGGKVEIEPKTRLGPILRDVPLRVIFEFVVEPSALEGDTVTLLNGMLKIFIAARPTSVPPLRLSFVREIQTEASTDAPSLRILSALSRLTLYRMQEGARTAADQGDFDGAARRLHNMATHLLSQGENSLAKTILFEAENLEKTQKWSGSGNQKDIKYGTRALLLSSPKEKA